MDTVILIAGGNTGPIFLTKGKLTSARPAFHI